MQEGVSILSIHDMMDIAQYDRLDRQYNVLLYGDKIRVISFN